MVQKVYENKWPGVHTKTTIAQKLPCEFKRKIERL
jgi:hypothetical protein